MNQAIVMNIDPQSPVYGSKSVSPRPEATQPHSKGFGPERDKNPAFRYFQRNAKGLHTLIVEDNIVDQKIAVGATAQLGMRTEVVDTGITAIERLKAADSEDPFDLVLLDYKLPNLDGLTACKHIKKELHLQHPPNILLLSAYHKDEIFNVHSDKTLVDGFITKPVSPHFLGSLIVDLHERSRLQQTHWPYSRHNDDELLKNCHVLLAEDNSINQRVAIGLLSRKGVRVTVAQNGQEAIAMVLGNQPHTFDVVLMDMDMPLVDGYEATRRIKRATGYADLPIVALTAHNSQKDRELCLEAGMSEYLTKPIKPNFLYEALLSFLR